MGVHPMTPAVRAQVAAARKEAALHGASVEYLTAGHSKHGKLVVRLGPLKRTISVPGTPRSGVQNATNMTRQDVRRAIREIVSGHS